MDGGMDRLLLLTESHITRTCLEDTIAPGCELLTPASWTELFDRLAEGPGDLILIDEEMLVFGGDRHLSRLRAEAPFSSILVMSDLAHPDRLARWLHGGRIEMICKPLQPSLLDSLFSPLAA